MGLLCKLKLDVQVDAAQICSNPRLLDSVTKQAAPKLPNPGLGSFGSQAFETVRERPRWHEPSTNRDVLGGEQRFGTFSVVAEVQTSHEYEDFEGF